jgi:hypothetical protein
MVYDMGEREELGLRAFRDKLAAHGLMGREAAVS